MGRGIYLGGLKKIGDPAATISRSSCVFLSSIFLGDDDYSPA